jgi:hypothetical protein
MKWPPLGSLASICIDLVVIALELAVLAWLVRN